MAAIKLSEQAFQFAELLLKYHTPTADEHGLEDHDELEAVERELTKQAPAEGNKAATDYEKWSRIDRTIPDEPKKKRGELDLEEPPKEAQVWGCAQDHRQVLLLDLGARHLRAAQRREAADHRRVQSQRRRRLPSQQARRGRLLLPEGAVGSPRQSSTSSTPSPKVPSKLRSTTTSNSRSSSTSPPSDSPAGSSETSSTTVSRSRKNSLRTRRPKLPGSGEAVATLRAKLKSYVGSPDSDDRLEPRQRTDLEGSGCSG